MGIMQDAPPAASHVVFTMTLGAGAVFIWFPREKPKRPWVSSPRRLDCGPGSAGSVAWLSATRLEKNLLMKHRTSTPITPHPEVGVGVPFPWQPCLVCCFQSCLTLGM